VRERTEKFPVETWLARSPLAAATLAGETRQAACLWRGCTVDLRY
jgi:hypothetical protein